jgi:hypothetical protein
MLQQQLGRPREVEAVAKEAAQALREQTKELEQTIEDKVIVDGPGALAGGEPGTTAEPAVAEVEALPEAASEAEPSPKAEREPKVNVDAAATPKAAKQQGLHGGRVPSCGAAFAAGSSAEPGLAEWQRETTMQLERLSMAVLPYHSRP